MEAEAEAGRPRGALEPAQLLWAGEPGQLDVDWETRPARPRKRERSFLRIPALANPTASGQLEAPLPDLWLQPPGVEEGASPGKQGDQKEEELINH